MLFGQQSQQETKSCRIGHEPKICQKFTEESWLATNNASIMCGNGGVGCGVGSGNSGGGSCGVDESVILFSICPKNYAKIKPLKLQNNVGLT